MKTLINIILFSLLLISPVFAGLEEVSNSVCRTKCKQGNDMYNCTAFAYAEDEKHYFLLSAGHCWFPALVRVDLCHDGYVKTIDGVYCAHKYIENTTQDFSVIGIKKSDFGDYSPLHILRWNYKKPEKRVWTYGCGDAFFPHCYKGIVTDVELDIKKTGDMILFSPPPRPGHSGGPLLNDKYEVIGMVIMSGPTGVCVSTTTLKELLNDESN